MNQSITMSHGPQPPPPAPRNSAMTSPSPSSPLTVKMNGSIPPPPIPISRNHNGLPLSPPLIISKHPGSNTPTKQTYDLCGPSPDSKVVLSHSVLHDTSQELMSRSIMSSSGAPRLRTPNPNPTPTPTAPSSLTVTGTIPSPTLMLNPMAPPCGSTHEQIQIHNRPIMEYSSCCATSIQEVLSSLALLAIVAVLLAIMAVVFLLKVMAFAAFDPNGKPSEMERVMCNLSLSGSIFTGRIVDSNEFQLVYEIIVGLITCSISLDFTCMLICCAQFIFASKLAKAPHGKER